VLWGVDVYINVFYTSGLVGVSVELYAPAALPPGNRTPFPLDRRLGSIYMYAIYIVLEGNLEDVRFEVFTSVTMKSAILWDVTPCGSCKNRSFAGTYRLHRQGEKNQRAGNCLSSN
jgi:hypothetical protein